MFVVKGKSGKVIGRYPTREAAARRIAQLKAGAQRLAPYKFGSARSPVAGGFDEHAADELRRQGILEEAVVLSTCNRSELYGVAGEGGARQSEWT